MHLSSDRVTASELCGNYLPKIVIPTCVFSSVLVAQSHPGLYSRNPRHLQGILAKIISRRYLISTTLLSAITFPAMTSITVPPLVIVEGFLGGAVAAIWGPFERHMNWSDQGNSRHTIFVR